MTTAELPVTVQAAGDAVLLVDLSSIAHPIWHVSASEPDPNATSTRIVDRVRQLASGHRHAAICVDSGRSFRADIDPTYKAQRPQQDAALYHQIDLAVDRLTADGFPIWRAKGFEADDIIATATAKAISAGQHVIIASADKDLLQLVQPRVRAKHPKDGVMCDEDGVVTRFGVLPHQMRDYLSLVGDSSDNIKGAKGIGPKTACELLQLFGSLDALFGAIDRGDAKIKPGTLASLLEFRPRWATVRSLIEMRTDTPINFDEVLMDRVPKDVDSFATLGEEDEMEDTMTLVDPAAPAEAKPEEPGQALVIRPQDVLPAAEYERQLDPRTPREVRLLAQDMFKSRMFSAYGSPEAVLSAIMVGRELGLPAMSALRSIHVVEGRHTLSSALMVALVLKSGMAEYFEPVEFDHLKATFETKRKGARKEVRLTHTIEMAMAAGLVKDKSNWVKVPTDMLVARAQSRLCRMVYPDLLAGLYTPEELEEKGNQ
jgi:5'-3' exonuclease